MTEAERALVAGELRKFADHYDEIHNGADHPITNDAQADYWRGADDAAQHYSASLRSHANTLEFGV